MEVKEAIEFCKSELYFDLENFLPSYQLEYNNKMRDIIDLLQQGEKYRQIVEDIKYELNWHKPEEPLSTAKLEVGKDEEYLNEILDMIDNIEQKYFPKFKKTITIEIKAKNEIDMKWFLDRFKSFKEQIVVDLPYTKIETKGDD